ncbi:MAG: cell division protein CrgA [Acidimicrobiia bacterium]|nr:cell division protein CrgA [Acidimicrobiia bacterium]
MVRQDKSKTGRVTPKGTVPQGAKPGPTATNVPRTSGDVEKPSPVVVPIVMFGSFILGIGLILFNYLPHGLFGMPSNWYLLGGLGLILVGIIAATQYR